MRRLDQAVSIDEKLVDLGDAHRRRSVLEARVFAAVPQVVHKLQLRRRHRSGSGITACGGMRPVAGRRGDIRHQQADAKPLPGYQQDDGAAVYGLTVLHPVQLCWWERRNRARCGNHVIKQPDALDGKQPAKLRLVELPSGFVQPGLPSCHRALNTDTRRLDLQFCVDHESPGHLGQARMAASWVPALGDERNGALPA